MSLHGENNNEAALLFAKNRHEADLPHALDINHTVLGVE